MKILVTGCAGFIGFHLTLKLSKNKKYEIYGIDNLNDYYDVNLKKDRLKLLKKNSNFKFKKIDISNKKKLELFFEKNKIEIVINLAAQAGVRYSLINPYSYVNTNINGFLNILENSKNHKIKHLIYASTSSVYGGNEDMPFKETHKTERPLQLYAATKKSNELFAHSYSNLYGLPTTGLRFFTVYGPWGRPDMALFLFTKSIYENRSIKIFNHGKHNRDFTYVNDIVEGISALIKKYPKKYFESNIKVPYRVFNIGNTKSVKLISYIEVLEKIIGKKAKKKFYDLQPGDVVSTLSNTNYLTKVTGYKPNTKIEDGIKEFVKWYNSYYLKNK
jgi:UDP-glucuronate 4-epimerase